MPTPASFTPDQLKHMVSDPGFTPDDWLLLSPTEQAQARPFLTQGPQPGAGVGSAGQAGAAPETLTSKLGQLLGAGASGAANLGIGAAKGLAEHTSDLVGMIPGVTKSTNFIGNALGGAAGAALHGSESVGPPVTPAEGRASLEPANTTQSVGKTLEGAGEYLAPAGAARKAAIEGLVRFGIPNSASPGAMKVMNKLAAILGRSAGEMGSAGAVSAAHGDEDPVKTGLMAGLIPPVVTGAAKAAKPLADTVLPIAAGIGTGHALGSAGLGLIGGMSMANRMRSGAEQLMTPSRVAALQQFIREYLPTALRGGLGAEEDARTGPMRVPLQGGR